MSEKLYDEIGQQLSQEHETTSSKMFGKPCLKTSANKAFAAFFKGEMVFKLGQEEVNLIREKYTGSVNWDPSGKNRPMKDWLQIPATYSNDWLELSKEALTYVENNS